MQCSIKVSALRREQNSHNAAEPRKANHLQHKAGPQMHAKPRLTKCQSCGMRRSGTKTKDMAKVHQLKLPHCVGCTGFQSVCWATGINTSTFCAGLWQRWLKCVAGHGRQRGAAGTWGWAPKVTGPLRAHCHRTVGAARPNPSLKLSANGMSRWPSSAGPAAHFALAVQRATPLSPA